MMNSVVRAVRSKSSSEMSAHPFARIWRSACHELASRWLEIEIVTGIIA
jgi:hypothetical protein